MTLKGIYKKLDQFDFTKTISEDGDFTYVSPNQKIYLTVVLKDHAKYLNIEYHKNDQVYELTTHYPITDIDSVVYINGALSIFTPWGEGYVLSDGGVR